MSQSNAFVIRATGDRDFPSRLPNQLAVQASSVDKLALRLADLTDAEVSILLIDVLDQDNHPANAQISVDGVSYYANIESCPLY